MNLLQMSFSAGIMIVFIVLIRTLFLNKLPKTTFLTLWATALIRLLLPLSFSVNFSFNEWLLQPFDNQTTAYRIGENDWTISSDFSFAPIENIDHETEAFPSTNNTSLAGIITTNNHNPTTINGLLIIWLTGIGITTTFFIFNYWKSHQKVRCAFPLEDNLFINEWKLAHQIDRSISMLISDQITTPLTTGFFKPKIVLPAETDFSNEANLQYILAHEFFHIKRWDSLWKILAIGALCLHWFNPLVWVMCILANRDLEISCDAWVVKQFGKATKKSYAYALIEMAEQKNGFMPFYSSFAKHATEERIGSIMKSKKTTIMSVVVAMIVIGLLTLNAFSLPVAADDEIYDKALNEFKTKVEVESESSDDWNSEARWDAVYASLIVVQTENMTFRIGDFDLDGSSREQFFFENERDWLDQIRNSGEYLSAEEVAIIVANAVDEIFDFNSDGTIFDIFLRPEYLNVKAENNRALWNGFIFSPDEAAAGVQTYFYFNIFADTGEIRMILYSRGEQFYPSDWLD